MLKLGLIINPVAGIGGKVGLKGSDGEGVVALAKELGARQESGMKAAKALEVFACHAGEFLLYTCAGAMGQEEAEKLRFRVEVIGGGSRGSRGGRGGESCGGGGSGGSGSVGSGGGSSSGGSGSVGSGGESSAVDTIEAAREMARLGVDLLIFAGGDGTARDVMDAVGQSIPVLGIPTGCKIHSAVYAINPKIAGAAVRKIIESGAAPRVREAEVMDIDEELFRKGLVSARLYGYMNVPDDRRRMQNLKSGRGMTGQAAVESLSNCIADGMEQDVLYIIGSGSTMMKVKEKLGIDGTLLGVDLVRNAKMVQKDATEKEILDALGKHGRSKIIVTVIGGQGYIFGRGNQQISSDVLKAVGKENILVAMSKDKADAMFMQNLYIDTSDEETNRTLCGYYRVLVGYDNYIMYKAVCE